MALEATVFLQDPLSYDGCKELLYSMEGSGGYSYGFGSEGERTNYLETCDNSIIEQCFNGYSYCPPSTTQSAKEKVLNNSSSPELSTGDGDGEVVLGGMYRPAAAAASVGRRKRRRLKDSKNNEEMENQRMTHIAVERNRRKQMNEYLAVLRSLMPPSYAQRGDQASTVGGAINFVKELEHLVHLLEAHKQVKQNTDHPPLFSNFFTFPQYSTSATRRTNSAPSSDMMMAEEKQSNVADIEVAMVESHANIKVLSTKMPKQLLKLVIGFQSSCLTILHLNITTVDHMVLYSFNVKVEEDCQLTTVNEIATAVHEMVGVIQEEAMST